MSEELVPDIFLDGYRSFADLTELYVESVEWIRSYVDLRQLSRLPRYVTVLDQLRGLGSLEDVAHFVSSPLHTAAFYEANEVIYACQGVRLVADSTEIPKAKFEQLSKGTYSYVEKGASSDISRDTFFEFIVASNLIRGGLPVVFSESGCDIQTRISNYDVFIECKRVASPKKLIKRLKEGRDQLATRYSKTVSNEMGMVFLSTDLIVNPALSLMAFPRHADAKAYIARTVKALAVSCVDSLKPGAMKLSPKTNAFYLSCHFPYRLGEDGPPSAQSYLFFNSINLPPGSRRRNVFDVFSEALKVDPVALDPSKPFFRRRIIRWILGITVATLLGVGIIKTFVDWQSR